MDTTFAKARRFVYQNARPVDLALWRYHFENGGREDVLTALSAYQNADGGFGHALEADAWNPYSSPIQTWRATEILREIGATDPAHDIIRGILRYLESGVDFDGRYWLCSVPANNEYAHAPWWAYRDNRADDDNPTATLAGFIVRFAERGSQLWDFGRRLCRQAYETFTAYDQIGDMHLIANYIQMLLYLEAAGEGALIDLNAFRRALVRHANGCVTRDTKEWASGYVCRPSRFLDLKDDGFFDRNRELALYERDFIRETQLPDGSWNVPWGWQGYEEQWHISKNWWKSIIVIENMLYLRSTSAL